MPAPSSDGSYIHVDFDQMDTLVTQLRTQKAAAADAIEKLGVQLNNHLGPWAGPARELYHTKHQQWIQAFAHMDEILNNAQNHVVNTNDIYRQAESDAQKTFGAL